jgi:hypothetical protein
MALVLQVSDRGQLVGGEQAGAPFADAGVVGDGAGDGLGIAGEHHDATDAGVAELRDELGGLGALLVGQAEGSQQPVALAEGQRGLAGLVQLGERGDVAAGALGRQARTAGPQLAAADAPLGAASGQ